MCIVGWSIGYASHVHKGLPSCTDNHRVERSHRLQTVEDDGVHVRDDLREHRKLVEREIEARWDDTGVIDVSILEDVTLRWVTSLLTMIPRFLFFFFSSCSLIENRRTRNLIFDSKVCKGILHKIIYKINIEIIFKKKKELIEVESCCII